MADVDAAHSAAPELEATDVPDDRARLGPGDRTLLVIDNDENFARFLMDMAHETGFKALVGTRGAAGIALPHQYRVDAVTLDIQLPDINGWKVLDRLKTDPATRHIPVYVITTEEDASRGVALGALGVLTKPIRTREALEEVLARLRGFLGRPNRRLVLLTASTSDSLPLEELLSIPSVAVVPVVSLAAATAAIAETDTNAVVVHLKEGRLEELRETAELMRRCSERQLPLIVYTPAELSPEAEEFLQKLSGGEVARVVRSPERLLDQASLYLHLPLHALPEEKRKMVEHLYQTDAILTGRKVMIVDDDIRNIFAMTSVLERQGMSVISAETGQEAIEKLGSSSGVDVVLMDIMMPGMDGYDTMRTIRRMERFRGLPIIAVTAKAMKGDREKTLQAGAWDYLAKPVDTDQMLSVLRAWLYR
jgi:CheY-like chemotaxis protein